MPPKKKTEFPCGFCKETTSSTHSIQCIICEFWHHKECIPGMTDEYYKQVTSLKEAIGTVYWLCEKCDVFNKKMMQSMNQLTKRMETLETREEANRKKGEDNETEIGKMRSRLEELEKKDKAGASSAEVFKEMGERENKQDNLIVHGLEEPPDNIKDGKKRAEKDYDNFQEVVDRIGVNIQVKDVVKFSRRLGEKKNSEPRPLQLGFKDKDARAKVLENAKKLKDEVEQFKKINIVIDLTKMQRDEEAKLEKEAKEKNEAMSDQEKAKNGYYKIVGKRGQRREVRVKEQEEIQQRRHSVRNQQQQQR